MPPLLLSPRQPLAENPQPQSPNPLCSLLRAPAPRQSASKFWLAAPKRYSKALTPERSAPRHRSPHALRRHATRSMPHGRMTTSPSPERNRSASARPPISPNMPSDPAASSSPATSMATLEGYLACRIFLQPVSREPPSNISSQGYETKSVRPRSFLRIYTAICDTLSIDGNDRRTRNLPEQEHRRSRK
jgi:hypothetical protein